jgi:hypothetical protein
MVVCPATMISAPEGLVLGVFLRNMKASALYVRTAEIFWKK